MLRKILQAITMGIILISVLASCNDTVYHWEFEQDCSAVVSIQIIDTQDGYTYEVVKELDLKLADELCEEIQKLEMEKYGTNLGTPNGYCFRIAYENGDYDVLAKTESKHFRFDPDSEKLQGYNSWLRCTDPDAFDQLIEQYSER